MRKQTLRQPTNERPEPEDLPAEHDDPHSSRSEGGRRLRPWDGQQALIIINFEVLIIKILRTIWEV
jgi:hypothetical protein